jgi:hypothetical protein
VESTANGTFDVTVTPGDPECEGAVARSELSKTFYGDLAGYGRGVMLFGGDPESGSAGYVAIEAVTGTLGGHGGSFLMQQFATMHNGSRALHYEVVPGSGTGALKGITGVLALTIEPGGTHRYALDYEL